MLRFRWLLAALVLVPAGARSDEPLRAVIDRELAAAWKEQQIAPAPKATDAEFLRRVTLDLVGTVPTFDETTKFLTDKDEKKREKLIDALLAAPRFAGAQANAWDLALLGRNPGNSSDTRVRP
ncbi:MAG TPA: DUF1549 domain-containing protein, partial [Gemmataceae bacterium]|nr:DUF1549 domain-containing protein [Gemmataceae bacterium]